MSIVNVLHGKLRRALPQVHQQRLAALMAAVGGLGRGATLSLTTIGRHLGGTTRVKHSIKRIDRLLGNRALHSERRAFCGWLARGLIGTQMRPVLLIDESDVDAARTGCILRAAIAVGGRALSVYEEVYAGPATGRLREQFLAHLGEVLPAGCRPILVSDAGYRSPWFAAVGRRGWYYVGRVRNRDHGCFPDTLQWFPARSLYTRATRVPKALGTLWLVRSRPFHTQAYRYRGPRKHRHDRTVHGQVARHARSRKCAAREREPWLLVSNLPGTRATAQRVVRWYRLRMQTEEGFRDLKSTRTGLAFRHSGTRQPQRLQTLLLIAALTTYLCSVMGQWTRTQAWDRGYQANTVRNRHVLSLFFLGMQWLARGGALLVHEFDRAAQTLRLTAQALATAEA